MAEPKDLGQREMACQIIEGFVKEEFARAEKPLFVSRDAPWLGRGAGDETEGEQLPHPIDACPNLASLIEEKGFKPKDSGERPETTDNGLFYVYDTLAVSLPRMSKDREEATFGAARVCGPLCAGGTLVTYKQSLIGAWVKDGEESLWIS